MIRRPRAGQRSLALPSQCLARLAFLAAVLATLWGFPAGAFAADPVTTSFTDSLGRTALYRYSLKDGWDPTQPRGLLVYFHGNNTGTRQDVLEALPWVQGIAYQHDLVPVVVASPETGLFDGITRRIWTEEDKQLVHELIQSQFGGDFSVDFGRIVFWGGSAGSGFLHGFVRSYGENYGGGLLAWCGFGLADPFWRPTQQFRERFRVLVKATTEDFTHARQTANYGYYKYTLGLETRGDLQAPGGHCRAGAYSWETAVGWLLDGDGIPEEPVEPHFERAAVFDYVTGLTVDGVGALWVVRQTPAQEDAAIWRSVDRGTTWESVSRVPLIVTDIDAAGDALFLTATTPDRWRSDPYRKQLYRSLDGGLNFTVTGGTDNHRLHYVNEPLVTDRDGKLYVFGEYFDADSPDVYVSDDLGESWTSLGLPREAQYDRITNPDGIWTEQSGLIVVSNLPPSPFWSSFSSAVGKTEGNDWRVLTDTPAGPPYSIAWDGSSIWGVAGSNPYSVFQSFDLGSTWLETELPSDPALNSEVIQRLSALNENQRLLFGGGGNVFLRDGGGVWRMLSGGATLGGWTRYGIRGTIGQFWDARITLDPSSGDVFASDGNGIFRLDAENRALSNVVARPDIDRDGVPDARDAFPSDPSEYLDTDGDGIGNQVDGDSDGDGVEDSTDGSPLDRYEVMDTDGDGVGDGADLDDDGDGVLDVFDDFPLDKQENADTDGDRIGDRMDADDDGDGVNDLADAFPRYPREWLDTDGDGIGDNLDSDDDNDGLADHADPDPLDGPEKPGFLRPADSTQLWQVIGYRDDRVILPVHQGRPSQIIYPDDLGDAPSFGYIRLGDKPNFEIQFAVDEFAWRDNNSSLAKVYFDRNGNGDLMDDGPPAAISSRQPLGIRIGPLEVPYASGEVVPYGLSIRGWRLANGGSTTAGSRISSVTAYYGGSWVGDVAAPNGSMILVQTVDYDIDGVFNRSPEDLVCIDVDRDRVLDCGPDGAERFRHQEPFTLDGQQLRALVAASGHRVDLVLAASPGFDPAGGPGDQTYTGGTAIGLLTLPAASGGDGTLTYSLTPAIPGLRFDAARRQLTGTPTRAGTYNMTYTATDADGNVDTLHFTITVTALVTPPEPESFSIPNLGGWSITSNGTEADMRSGYGRIRADAGRTTPSGIAIFGFRQGGVLIAEAGVPATEPVQEGRIFAEVNDPVNTGLAIANPNDTPATILFYFRDAEGVRFGDGQFELGAHEQTAKFLNDAPFNSGELESGTFTFTSSVPIAVIALRGLTNRDGEFLMTTLPIAPLAAPRTPFSGNTGSADTVYFPHFTDGNGWVTQVILVNPTDTTITGTVRFLGPGSGAMAAAPANLTLDDDRTGSEFPYSIPAGSSQRFTTSNPMGIETRGSVRATPNPGSVAPSGLVVFSYTPGGVKTVSESGVPALPAGSAFRVYAESSGTLNQAGSIRTGLAITNAADTANMVTLEVTSLDGNLATGVAPVTLPLPPSGQVARFLDEIFDSLPNNFTGVLRVTSTADVAIVGLRLRINERGELKMTTTPPSNETDPPPTADRFFPHIVDSAGWSTQFILFSGTAGQTSPGTLSFIDTAGEPWDLPTTNGVSGSLPPGSGTVADLVVQSPSVSDASPEPGQSFDLRATVRNAGTGGSTATTLRFYRSSDATISSSDTEVGADAVSALAAGKTRSSVLTLTAPSTAGTYYYAACVDPVSGESDTGNNCSSAVTVTASASQMASAGFDLASANGNPQGIVFANDRFFVVDRTRAKVYAYQTSGQRDSASDFDLDSANENAEGITFANNRFFVVDRTDDMVYAYSAGAAPGTTDSQPSFGTATVSNRTYTVGTAISALTLPAASGGNGTLTYSLSPAVAGLTFSSATRRLTGTPTTAGSYPMTYTVRDADGDTATLRFTITVQAGGGGSSTQWTTGQTSTSMPTGDWSPTMRCGVGSYSRRSDGRSVSYTLSNGVWIEYNNRRWTCASSGGCAVNNRLLTMGTIVETAAGGGGGGGGSSMQWTTGQTITSMPTGNWFGSLSRGTFRASGGIVSITLQNGGWVEYMGRRWTCASSGGCAIENRLLTQGTIVETAAGGG